MGCIYISYGITKSASTFAWQLIKSIAIQGGLPVATLTSKSKGVDSPEDYIDPIIDEKLRLIGADVGDAPVVLKTHGYVTPTVARLVTEGKAQVFVSYRDLRDVALSLLDHGARSRHQGIRDFAEFYKPLDTFDTIRDQVERFENWVQSCEPLLIPYDEICFDTRTTIHRVAERLGVFVNVDAVFAHFEENKSQIGQFNKGKQRRFEREMSRETSEVFLDQFFNYFRKYFSGALADDRGVTAPESLTRSRESEWRSVLREQPTEELVDLIYRAVLRREPDETGRAAAIRHLESGWSELRLIHSLMASEEFRSATLVKDKKGAIPDLQYRCPTDLEVTQLPLRRVIVIGRCLMTDWPNILKGMRPECQCDYFLFNNVQSLPQTLNCTLFRPDIGDSRRA